MKKIFAIATLALLLAGPRAFAQSQPVVTQASNAAEGSHVFSGTTLYTLAVSWNAATTARYVMVFDGTALPSNGATTACTTTQATGCLAWCAYMPNSGTAPDVQTFDWGMHPLVARNGIVAAASTGGGCGTLTVDGTNDFFYAQVR